MEEEEICRSMEVGESRSGGRLVREVVDTCSSISVSGMVMVEEGTYSSRLVLEVEETCSSRLG